MSMAKRKVPCWGWSKFLDLLQFMMIVVRMLLQGTRSSDDKLRPSPGPGCPTIEGFQLPSFSTSFNLLGLCEKHAAIFIRNTSGSFTVYSRLDATRSSIHLFTLNYFLWHIVLLRVSYQWTWSPLPLNNIRGCQ